MKAEFVNAFLTPALDVWKKELGQELTYHGAHSVAGTFTTEDLTAIIGVAGGLKGNVFYELSNATALAVAGAMCGTTSVGELDEVGLSAIGELANIITGNATVELAAAQYVCDIARRNFAQHHNSRKNCLQIKYFSFFNFTNRYCQFTNLYNLLTVECNKKQLFIIFTSYFSLHYTNVATYHDRLALPQQHIVSDHLPEL